MNAKDFYIDTVQQEDVWLTIAKKIVRDHTRMLMEQRQSTTTNKEVRHAEVRNGV